MWHGVTSRAITVSRNVLENRRQIFFVHFVYSGFSIIVLFPLVGLLGRVLLSLSGNPVLTDQDILFFALTPLGAASFVFLGGLLLFIAAIEQASLMTIAGGGQHHREFTVFGALQRNLEQAPRILAFALRLVVRLVLLILPFLAASAVVAMALLTEYDINYYLTDRPPEFWWAVISIGALLSILLLILVHKLLEWSMSLPLVLFSDISPARCFRTSVQLMRASRTPLLVMMALWAAAALLLSTLVVTIVRSFGTALLFFVGDSIRMLVFALGVVVTLAFLASLLVTALTSGSFAYVIIDFFARVGPNSSGPHSRPTQQRSNAPPNGRPRTRRLVGVLLVVSVGVAGLVGIWLLNGIQFNDSIAVIAHRGAAGSAPENTLASVRQAIEDGADWIEIDVQETVDGVVVVIHDSDFMKLAGIDLNVRDGTLDQVRAIDVGRWFSPEFADERVPTLAEVLEEVDGRSRVIIELKYYGYDQQLEQRVIDIVEQFDLVDDVMIMSLSYEGIQKIRALRPEWTIGLLVAQAAGNLARLDTDFLAVHERIATAQLIRAAGVAGKQVFVWTINDAVNMSRILSLGVDGIITDEPGLAREVLAARSKLSSAERLLLHTALLLGEPVPQTNYRDESP
jgi:glycerophosphoryl diester phosphodiesterase